MIYLHESVFTKYTRIPNLVPKHSITNLLPKPPMQFLNHHDTHQVLHFTPRCVTYLRPFRIAFHHGHSSGLPEANRTVVSEDRVALCTEFTPGPEGSRGSNIGKNDEQANRSTTPPLIR